MRNSAVLTVFLATLSLSISAGSTFDYSFLDDRHEDVCQLIPERKVSQVRTKSASKSRKSFDDILRTVQVAMGPAIKASGLQLRWEIDWNSQIENAAVVSQGGKRRNIEIHGGLYRNSKLSADGFTFVLCHELGHILGGAPLHLRFVDMSAEGQADYYSTNVCLPLVFKGQNNIEAIRRMKVPQKIRSRCDSKWKNKEHSAICQRSIMASFNTMTWIAGVGDEHIELGQRERDRADGTNTFGYPSAQCRLDTAMAGAYCNKGATSTSKIGAPSNCSALQFIKRDGARPDCWFIK